MFKNFISFTLLVSIFFPSPSWPGCFDCCQSVDIGVGWRRDNITWKLNHVGESCLSAEASSHITFEDVDIYMIHGKARWLGEAYYIRLSGDYGLTDKGRADEVFKISSPFWDGTLCTEVSHPIKRRSEVFDFSAAVGYPMCACDTRLSVIPLFGFSFHRQRLRAHRHDHSSTSCSCSSSSSDIFCSDGPFFFDRVEDSSHPFEPFSSGGPSNIANIFGLCPKRNTSVYRFTWYGFFVGFDVAYALDPTWTLFTEIEIHGVNRANRKRNSNTFVDFIDEYHSKEYAYGINGTVGTTIYFGNCWYSILAVDFKYWDSDCHNHDSLVWKSVGINLSLGYIF